MKIAASDVNHCSFLAAGYEPLQSDHAEVALWEFSKRLAQRAIHRFGYSRMKQLMLHRYFQHRFICHYEANAIGSCGMKSGLVAATTIIAARAWLADRVCSATRD